MIEVIGIILGAILLTYGASALDATPKEKHFTYPSFTEDQKMPRYKIVCRTPKGIELFTVESFETLEAAEAQAVEFNRTRGTDNVWTAEPLRYN